MSDAIDMIVADHRLVDALFDEFERTGDGSIAARIADRLTDHDQVETNVLYPFAVSLGIGEDAFEHSALAHEGVRRQIDAMRSTEGVALIAAVQQLRTLVEAHVEEEETVLLPALRKAASEDELATLASKMLAVLQRVG